MKKIIYSTLGSLLISTTNGNADLSLQLMKTDDLITWTNAGPAVEWSIPVATNQQFFRVRAEP